MVININTCIPAAHDHRLKGPDIDISSILQVRRENLAGENERYTKLLTNKSAKWSLDERWPRIPLRADRRSMTRPFYSPSPRPSPRPY